MSKKPLKIQKRDLRDAPVFYRPGTPWFTNGQWLLNTSLWDLHPLMAAPKGATILKADDDRWAYLVTALERPHDPTGEKPGMGGRDTEYRRTPLHLLQPDGECVVVYAAKGGGLLGIREGIVELIAARAASGFRVAYAPAVPAGEWYFGFASVTPSSGLDVGTHTARRPDLGRVLDVARALLAEDAP